MKSLVLQCAYVAYSYQGVRLTAKQKEEVDWPPAPGRLHQALVAAALIGIPTGNEEELANRALTALQWLERQPPPEIIASAISEDLNSATSFRVAIPQNNPAKSDLTRTSLLLAPTLARRAVPQSGQRLEVVYRWKLQTPDDEKGAEINLAALSDLVAQVRYLGRAEDQVEANLSITEEINTASVGRETWLPTNERSDGALLVAQPDTTANLIRNHSRPIPARTRRSPASRFLRVQGYAREALGAARPVHVALLRLIAETGNPDEPPLSCDAETAGVWRSRIREKAIDLARDSARWDHPDLAQELISGHPAGKPDRTELPHLAFVPLPSVNSQGKADGRVRRVALVGYAPADIQAEARDVYRALSASLDLEQVDLGRSHYRLEVLSSPPESDKVWSQIIGSSRIWHSVTPVALAGGFKVPKYSTDGNREISSNERHARRLAEVTALLRSSLRHIGLPTRLTEACAIILTAAPLLPNTSRAERYRPPGESAFLTHARIEFSELVRGPLLVGDRRYQGFGLFLPA